MKQSLFICAVGLLAYIGLAHAGSTMVWLEDVTTGLANDKRTFGDFDLPNELTFHLKRGLDVLNLNLKRNYDINPNADVYFAHRLDDGRFNLVKTPNLDKGNVAYYQDIGNGAYMTVRCVKSANDRCNRVINGNIRIGDRSYDLRPAEEEVTSRSFLDILGHRGKRYVLQDQADIKILNSLESKEQTSVNKKNREQELTDFVRRLHEQHKQNQLLDSEAMISSRNASVFLKRWPADRTRQLKENYYVDVAVLIDSGLWDSYSWTVSASEPGKKVQKVKEKIREAYSHIINGVNLLYKGIEDNIISISVTLSAFIFFQEGAFERMHSKVTTVNGTNYIHALSYLKDLFIWDRNFGEKELPTYDQAILFTDFNLYMDTILNNTVGGISFRGRICEVGARTSVVEAGHYVQTVSSAAHELGHSLGAWHDGEGTATACDREDYFIMSPVPKPSGRLEPYSTNPWLFSKCSIKSFNDTLKNKHCVTSQGRIWSLSDWNKYMRKQPAQVYTPAEQCRLINGPNSLNCGTVTRKACYVLRCTDPETYQCQSHYISAPMGTECGVDKWCIKGRCVKRKSNQ